MKTRYKHIHFEDDGAGFYYCKNNRSNNIIGGVSYYTSWKRYVFEGVEGCVFDTSCLQDICHFMGQL